jgi:hypothetical protein
MQVYDAHNNKRMEADVLAELQHVYPACMTVHALVLSLLQLSAAQQTLHAQLEAARVAAKAKARSLNFVPLDKLTLTEAQCKQVGAIQSALHMLSQRNKMLVVFAHRTTAVNNLRKTLEDDALVDKVENDWPLVLARMPEPTKAGITLAEFQRRCKSLDQTFVLAALKMLMDVGLVREEKTAFNNTKVLERGYFPDSCLLYKHPPCSGVVVPINVRNLYDKIVIPSDPVRRKEWIARALAVDDEKKEVEKRHVPTFARKRKKPERKKRVFTIDERVQAQRDEEKQLEVEQAHRSAQLHKQCDEWFRAIGPYVTEEFEATTSKYVEYVREMLRATEAKKEHEGIFNGYKMFVLLCNTLIGDIRARRKAYDWRKAYRALKDRYDKHDQMKLLSKEEAQAKKKEIKAKKSNAKRTAKNRLEKRLKTK